MKKMKFNEIRRTWIDFFKEKNHVEFESQSLIPKDDNSLLWINSGVATLKKYFSGKESLASNRVVSSQRCIRTNDIENVGITSRHHTLFEMLGNFSIGDYFKEEAIEFAFEFLTKKLEMDVNKLYITVYEDDDITLNKWTSLGIIPDHIIKCGKDRNFWDLGSGPCGPCTEIYYDRGEKYDSNNIGEELFFKDIENDRYVEIWNIVFSEFNNINGEYTLLERKNIDTGAGLERLASIMQEAPTDFDTDGFIPIIDTISSFTDLKYDVNAYFKEDIEQNKINKNYRIIADHLKACSFAISDGAIPSNKDRGYIIRKLIRRSKLSMYFLDIKNNECIQVIIESIINVMKDYYPYLIENKDNITSTIKKEMELFDSTLIKSESLFKESIHKKMIDGKTLFNLVDTYGMPIEVIREIESDLPSLSKIFNFNEEEIKILESGIKIEFDKFDDYFNEHKKISKNKKQENNFDIQNSALVNLDCESIFRYDLSKCKGKIIKLYNANFIEVDSVKNEECYIVLDKTCFYATSGGQLCDSGTINEYKVIDVFKATNGQHIHKINNATFNLNETVKEEINWERRRRTSINHTCEHILHSALKNMIDNNIKQEGAFKSQDKLTFDFQLSRKLEKHEINKIEEFVNYQIKRSLDVSIEYMSLEESKRQGVIGYFENKYKKIKGDLRVVKIGDISMELCGGTHIPNSKYISLFKIIKYESKGSGSWRLECITTKDHINLFVSKKIEDMSYSISNKMKEIKSKNIPTEGYIENISIKFQDFRTLISDNPITNIDKIETLYSEIMIICDECLNNGNKLLEAKLILFIKNSLASNESYISYCVLKDFPQKIIQNALLEIINEIKNKSFFVFNETNEKIQYFGAQSSELKTRNIADVINKFNKVSNGRGGGKPNFAQGGTQELDSLDKLISVLNEFYKN